MQKKADGQNYAPKGKPSPVVGAGEFKVAAVGLDHGHIYGMCNGLVEAGAEITVVYDPDPAKVEAFIKEFPTAVAVSTEAEALAADVKLVACASIPSDRCGIGIRAMEAGKDFFADKPAMINREQIAAARAAVKATGRKFMIYFSERLHVESAVYAEELIANGAIGKVVSVAGFGPHRLNAPTRPAWHFNLEENPGILIDIGCHQIEQIMFFTGAGDATIGSSRVTNYNCPEQPQFYDYGDATITCDNGATGYLRVDWLTPKGLGAWGDGRTTIVGTEGYMELRKYIDVANDPDGDHIYMANQEGEFHFTASGKCGFPFFGKFIKDCINGTEIAITQEHTFRVMELAIEAQEKAVKLEGK